MNFCEFYCSLALKWLEPLKKNMKIFLAHENPIKNVPLDEIIAAIRIKKCIIFAPADETNDNSVKVASENRKVSVTLGINLYVPYQNGTKISAQTFDNIFEAFYDNAFGFREAKLLSTKYSRETQCLVTETEFVFENELGRYECGPFEPIVPGPSQIEAIDPIPSEVDPTDEESA